MPSRVSHFEIHADDVERCKKFYTDVFGWKMMAYPMPDGTTYWGVETGPREAAGGINGGIMERKGPRPAENAPVFGYVCTMQVENYDASHDAILANGGTVALPKHAIPGMAWQGYYKDTEGNIFGIHQPDTEAK
jgi:hypothetical protein